MLADVFHVLPNDAAEYDRGLRAAPLGGSQCEPVATRSCETAVGEANKRCGVGIDVGESELYILAGIACQGSTVVVLMHSDCKVVLVLPCALDAWAAWEHLLRSVDATSPRVCRS